MIEKHIDDFPSQQELEVGDEVRIDIATDDNSETSCEHNRPHIGTIAARWKSPDGALWAIVEIVRTANEENSSYSTRPHDYRGCLFLARPCSPEDCYAFQAMRAADANTEQVVARVKDDIDDLRALEYIEQWRASMKGSQ